LLDWSKQQRVAVHLELKAIEGSGSRTGQYFSFDGVGDTGARYHLLTRGHSDEGNLQIYFFAPGDGPVSAAPLNCTIARN